MIKGLSLGICFGCMDKVRDVDFWSVASLLTVQVGRAYSCFKMASLHGQTYYILHFIPTNR